MNKDRIQINGKWYVAEQPEEDAKFDPGDLTYFRGAVYETDSSCFEFTNLTNEEGKPYMGVIFHFLLSTLIKDLKTEKIGRQIIGIM